MYISCLCICISMCKLYIKIQFYLYTIQILFIFSVGLFFLTFWLPFDLRCLVKNMYICACGYMFKINLDHHFFPTCASSACIYVNFLFFLFLKKDKNEDKNKNEIKNSLFTEIGNFLPCYDVFSRNTIQLCQNVSLCYAPIYTNCIHICNICP